MGVIQATFKFFHLRRELYTLFNPAGLVDSWNLAPTHGKWNFSILNVIIRMQIKLHHIKQIIIITIIGYRTAELRINFLPVLK